MKTRKLEERIVSLEKRTSLLESRNKELLQMLLFLCKETHVLNPGLVNRSLENLRQSEWGRE